jgi:hypothetical protein
VITTNVIAVGGQYVPNDFKVGNTLDNEQNAHRKIDFCCVYICLLFLLLTVLRKTERSLFVDYWSEYGRKIIVCQNCGSSGVVGANWLLCSCFVDAIGAI